MHRRAISIFVFALGGCVVAPNLGADDAKGIGDESDVRGLAAQLEAKPGERPMPGRPVVVRGVDFGFLSTPKTVVGRDGGHAVKIAGGMTWMFSDTLLGKRAVDTGLDIRSSTAARGPAGPYREGTNALDDSEGVSFDNAKLDGAGVPFEHIAFTADELAFNKDNHPSNGKRKAHWSLGAVVRGSAPSEEGIVFFTKLDCERRDCVDGATFTDSFQNAATVTDGKEKLLFERGTPAFRPSGLVDRERGLVYVVHAEAAHAAFAYRIGRAPISQLENADRYEYWKGGDTWSPGQDGAALMGGGAMPGNTASITYNAYLKKYVMVSTNWNTSIMVRVADSPVGQWSEPTEVTEGLVPSHVESTFGNYAGQEQPELAMDDGKTIVVSYANTPTASSGTIRLMGITFGATNEVIPAGQR